MTKPMSYIILPNAISLTDHNHDNHIIEPDHPNYNLIRDKIKRGDWEDMDTFISIPKAIAKASKGIVEVINNVVYHNGLPVHSHLALRIVDLMKQGFDIEPWVNFMEKLYQNPDPFSITQLYTFLERAKLPLTPDGDFLAYKKVRANYFDIHSGQFDNSVGKTPSIDRKICDNNPDNHCSRGLHFCSKGYLSSFGGSVGSGYRVVLVKVNPRDVVSVPNDHHCEKARACIYKVVGELDEDYSFDDMETSEVLPTPGVKAEVNKVAKTTNQNTSAPNDLQLRVLNYKAATVRETARNLGLKNSDIVNNAGHWYVIEQEEGESIGSAIVRMTTAGYEFFKGQ